MARLIGLLTLLLGLGMTTYYSHKEPAVRTGDEVRMMEGGDPAPPTPKP
jgi:hypothetical protein